MSIKPTDPEWIELSPSRQNSSSYVNMFQSADERKQKYQYVLELTQDTDFARRLRDWRWSTLQGALDVYMTHVKPFLQNDPKSKI